MGSARPARVTIYDVARQAGVSKSLVSLVLQGSPQVGAARREAVQQAIRDLGYRPSRAAAALAGQRSNTIGVVIDDFANPWFVDLLAGLRTALEDSRFHVSVADSVLNSHLQESPVQGFLAARVDGLVLAGEPSESDIGGIRVPTVLIGNRRLQVADADVVGADEMAGARLAVEHLLELGHRRIAFIDGPSGPAAMRAQGYREAMRSAGCDPIERMALETTDRGGHAAARQLLAADRAVTAIFAANDVMALGAWQAVREVGRVVPEDVSVLGYDDSPMAGIGLLQLTSVDGRSAQVGELAARLLLRRIADPAPPPARREVVPRLVVRRSTGPVPSGIKMS